MMPPKVVRGAAAKVLAAKAKAKAGAKAAAGVRRRPAARARGGLRRPAAGGGERADVEGEGAHKPGLGLGDLVEAHTVSALEWVPGQEVAFEGSYWQAPCQVAGLVQAFTQEGVRAELQIAVQGTTSDRLLKWATGHKTEALRLHLCPKDCSGDEVADDLFHAVKAKVITGSTRLPWMRCLEEVKEDELPDLRDELEKRGKEKGSPEKVQESSRSSGGKKRKKEKRGSPKRKKKEKKAKRSGQKDKKVRDDPVAPGARFKGQMRLDGVFGGTGLDPSMDVRRDVRRRVRRSLKSKKKKEDSEEGSGSSETSDSLSLETLFPETKKVRSVVKRAPGALAAQAIEEMQEQLITASGQMWSMDTTGTVPPLVLHYYRSVMRQRMTGGIAREALTLAYLIDLALQGRVAECLDVGLQRLKSLELTSSGTDYRISQRIELTPPELESFASNAERKEALQEAKEEMRLKSQCGKGGDWWRADPWRNQEKGGWGKKDGKGKDGKKGDKGSSDRYGKDGKGDDRGGHLKKDDKKK